VQITKNSWPSVTPDCLELSDDLLDPTLSTDSFRRRLKLGCFQSTSTYSALEVSHFVRYINS